MLFRSHRTRACLKIVLKKYHEPRRFVSHTNRGGLANRGGSRPTRTKPWGRGAVRGANRTVGVAHGSVCGRTEPHGSRFEPWSILGKATDPNSEAIDIDHGSFRF